MSINLLLDSGDPETWEEWIPTGIFNGITTNPSLLKKAKQPCTIEHLKKLSLKASHLGCKELHLQAWGETAEELITCGMNLKGFANANMRVYIKIPITFEGSNAAKNLIASNLSLIHI